MKNRRLLSVLLCALLCIGLIPATVFAANEEPDTWDGTSDISWYTGDKTEYNIDSAAALAGVSQLAAGDNKFKDVTLNLTTDVDLAGLAWTPIKEFCGTFNGGGHTVYNMHVELEEGQSGFFEHLRGATVKDLVLKQAEVVVTETNTSFYQGILAGWAQNSSVENCGTTGSITANLGDEAWSPSVGGLIGSCKVIDSLKNCWSTADVKTTNPDENAMVGGLVGQWEDAATGAQIIDCYFGGTVCVAEKETAASGILGAAVSFNGEVVLISGCVSYGEITTPAGSEANAVHVVMLDKDGKAEYCMWPADGKAGVVRLIIVWEGSTGHADPDPDFDETACGQSVEDFSDPSVIETLNAHAQTPGLWALGINGYPVFSTQTDLVLADYSAIDAAKAKVPEDLTIYTDETAGNLKKLLDSINEKLSKDYQSEVDDMAKAIEEAIANLEKKPQPTPTPTPTPDDDDDDRIAGDDRFETAVEVADSLKKDWGVSRFKTIIVACSDDFADAMSATPLAIDRKAPILLVNENTEDFVRNYINKNLTKGGKVYIIGETGVVSKNFENSLTCAVERLGGLDRYLTNLEVLEELGVTAGDDIMVASALNYPDALSVSATGNPILLVKDKLFDEQKEYLGGLKGAHDYFIIGETEAVNNTVMGEIKKYGTTERVGGANRYETSVDVAEKFYDKVKRMYVASGDDFPDALTGGVIANANDAPLLLVNKNNTSQAAAYASAKGITKVVAIGGTAVIPDEILDKIA